MDFQNYTFHEATEAFPLYPYYNELLFNIDCGQPVEPLKILDGQIIDGRTRFKICVDLGREVDVEEVEGNPYEIVWELNRDRGDLSPVQRYLIWWYCYEKADQHHADQQRASGSRLVLPREKQIPQRHGSRKVSIEDCAKHAGVYISAVHRGDRLLRNVPDLIEAVRLGTMTPARAAKRIPMDKTVRMDFILKRDPEIHEMVRTNKMSLAEALRRVK